MPARSSAIPSPQARRQALREGLALALAQRDASGLQRLTGQWVHRHGVEALELLMAELAEGELLLWWQEQLQALVREPVQGVGQARQLPEAHLPPAPSVLPAAAPQPRPAPAPSHPALASLRAWLPDPQENSFPQENSRAA